MVKFDGGGSNSLVVMAILRWTGARTPKFGPKSWPSVKLRGFCEKVLTVTHIFFQF